ncbi:sensor histidine kinase [Virgibacillus pantothenticus]|uniref:Sensor histidine kinase n=1 Tax=Virgibacillus pantothenticus TaxID=1473 RepID=A0A0L0QNK8_VIRPA|nr:MULTISPECIES: sensor histidine kinase [Virgibacillus]API93545.1 two-component sensor histidine kinase [Virgibacillus sp. 6R]KNE19838.1 histidine kinase [Virgibacillus pantothenticus]MBS7430069.1 sensor histidine kinase [Virgibacillus sp. 19R1-5]MBU8564834.1 sensor histidine kinase [Virgibacillus pantothenticus]MBU8599142.1 sensor histidine kinase [Virgibacillus pantothenticus]
MNLLFRHISTSIFYSIVLTILVTGVTLFAFVDDWSTIFDKKIEDISFLFILFVIPVSVGIVTGTVTGLYWRQRIHYLEKKMEEIIKGQKLNFDLEIPKDLGQMQHYLEQVQHKIRMQTEHAQRLATERAVEREQSLQEIVVQERNRLARELHDSVSQQLFAASMMMSTITETNPPKDETIQKQLRMVENMIQQSQLEMRALLLHLRPVALKGKSLQEGTQELLMELTQKVPIQVDWNIEAFIVDKGVEDQLFRILQEALSNTLRHAKANSLHVMLVERDGNIILRVTDDGVGFDMGKLKTGSYGLQNMRERAYEVGGSYKVISFPNQGTRLEVKVPHFEKGGEEE